jgi:hypothetical protein
MKPKKETTSSSKVLFMLFGKGGDEFAQEVY